jgi:hypothetical protein
MTSEKSTMASPTSGQDDFWEHVRAAYPEQQPLLT